MINRNSRTIFAFLILLSICIMMTEAINTYKAAKSLSLNTLRMKRLVKEDIPEENKCWIGNLIKVNPEFKNYKITDLIIPGCHDAAIRPKDKHIEKMDIDDPFKELRGKTHNQIAQSLFYTQAHTILDLMKIGVRFFDVRYTLEDNNLFSYHGEALGITLLDKKEETAQKHLQNAADFLKDCPNDFLIFKVKLLKEENAEKYLEVLKTIKDLNYCLYGEELNVGKLGGKLLIIPDKWDKKCITKYENEKGIQGKVKIWNKKIKGHDSKIQETGPKTDEFLGFLYKDGKKENGPGLISEYKKKFNGDLILYGFNTHTEGMKVVAKGLFSDPPGTTLGIGLFKNVFQKHYENMNGQQKSEDPLVKFGAVISMDWASQERVATVFELNKYKAIFKGTNF